jgi:hypothetical protein
MAAVATCPEPWSDVVEDWTSSAHHFHSIWSMKTVNAFCHFTLSKSWKKSKEIWSFGSRGSGLTCLQKASDFSRGFPPTISRGVPEISGDLPLHFPGIFHRNIRGKFPAT